MIFAPVFPGVRAKMSNWDEEAIFCETVIRDVKIRGHCNCNFVMIIVGSSLMTLDSFHLKNHDLDFLLSSFM